MRHDYSPFAKPFTEVEILDLAELRTVSEGWYVEYKREMSNAATIAKSVSAFSNTYGGWIFYGVADKSKDETVAGEFVGIPKAEADAALQRIRQSLASNVQPSPYFEAKALHGPEPTLGLPEGRSIIAVRVPWGADAPYIHKDGRIYRRVADGSEPRPESDRFIVDQLSGRSSKIEGGYDDWIDNDLETSKHEENAAYIRIFLIADFWREHPDLKNVPISVIRSIMRESTSEFGVPLNNVYRTTGAIVCRQPNSLDPEALGLTWILHHDFRSEIIIPLNKIRAGDLDNLATLLAGYDGTERFMELCRGQGFKNPDVIDLNFILIVLVGLARKHAALASEFGWDGPMLAKIRISGVWRTVPFFDERHVLDEYEEHGIALCLTEEIATPPGKGRSSYFELPLDLSPEPNTFPNFLMALHIFRRVASALGAAVVVGAREDPDSFSKPIVDFMMAGQRAIAAQRGRQRPISEP